MPMTAPLAAETAVAIYHADPTRNPYEEPI